MIVEGFGSWFVYDSIERPLVPVVMDMERRGVLVDVPRLERMGEELVAKREALLAHWPGINLTSHQQVKAKLWADWGIKTDSVDEPHLRKILLTNPENNAKLLIDARLENQELVKMEGTYVRGLLKWVGRDGRIHARCNQVGAETGRTSYFNPNLQNIPVRKYPEFRECFIAPDGYSLLAADYSQVEYRVVAILAGEQGLIVAWYEDVNADAHLATTLLLGLLIGGEPPEVVKRQRDKGKTLNFGLLYGLEDASLALALGVTLAEAKRLRHLYWERLAAIAAWVEGTKYQILTEGYVETYFGRRNYVEIPDGAPRWLVEKMLREGVNMPVQGTAADIEKILMPQANALGETFGAGMNLMVHDEVVFEVPQGREEEFGAELQELGRNVVDIGVPLKLDVKYGHTWRDAH